MFFKDFGDISLCYDANRSWLFNNFFSDNTPFGDEQLIGTLTLDGETVDLTNEDSGIEIFLDEPFTGIDPQERKIRLGKKAARDSRGFYLCSDGTIRYNGKGSEPGIGYELLCRLPGEDFFLLQLLWVTRGFQYNPRYNADNKPVRGADGEASFTSCTVDPSDSFLRIGIPDFPLLKKNPFYSGRKISTVYSIKWEMDLDAPPAERKWKVIPGAEIGLGLPLTPLWDEGTIRGFYTGPSSPDQAEDWGDALFWMSIGKRAKYQGIWLLSEKDSVETVEVKGVPALGTWIVETKGW